MLRDGGERIEVEPRGRHQVEVGDAGPQPGRRFVPVVCVFEDEDRVHAVGRHHPGHDPERRLGRAADDAAAHRVCDGRGLERDGQLVPAILCIDHARIVVAPLRSRIRVNYGTGNGAGPEPCLYIPIAW